MGEAVMYRPLLVLGLLAALWAWPAPAPRATADEKDKKDKKGEKKDDAKGWVQLFNRKDLTGWKTHPKSKGHWEVKDKVLIGSGPTVSHLFSERGDYENFHFRIEARISDKGNSGQYFRAKFGPGYPKGYEAQINSTHPDPQKTGSLWGFAPVKKMLVKPDTWFTQEVIAKGNHIIILVNGKKTVDFVDKKKTYTKGHFAIQQHDKGKDLPESRIEVRKIEVKELPPSPKATSE
jgi:hypothetical protein